MGVIGMLVGGVIGWSLGGPLGGLIGGALGSNIGGGKGESEGDGYSQLPPPPPPPGGSRRRVRRPVSTDERRVAIFVATFGVMGHIAKADGRVTEEEAQLAHDVMRQLNLNSRERRLAADIFRQGKSPHFDLDGALYQLRQVAGPRRNLLRSFVETQIAAAWADGSVHPAERRILNHIGAVFGFTAAELAQMERIVSGPFQPREKTYEEKLNEAYGVLGLDPSATSEEIRSTYRRLMRQHHPDRLAAQGLPEEMKQSATKRTQEIQKAYSRVKDHRKAA